ncbi:MAG: FtsX-like permease family protein, partial [Saprospiraceae bacterium]
IYQFVTENIIITLIGGASSFLISFLLIYTINNSSIGSTFHLAFNGKLFIYSFLICILFGIISGIIPAWRMSKLHIVEALNGKKK